LNQVLQSQVLQQEGELPGLLREASSNRQRLWPCGRQSRLRRVFHQDPKAEHVISTAKLQTIHWLDREDQTCEVDVGLSPHALQQELAPLGLELGVESPGNQEGTLGGLFLSREVNLLHQAYGHAREQVLGLRAYLADGTQVQAGSRVVKSVAGYDLTRLLLGSEGRLAVVTRLILRLHPRPKALDWRRIPIANWPNLRQSLPTPRYAFQLAHQNELFVAWPSPLPQVAASWPQLDPALGEAARVELLNSFAECPQRVAYSRRPQTLVSGPFDWNSLQAPWSDGERLPSHDPDAQMIPPRQVPPSWAALRRALAPQSPTFGPQDD
jgi:hypothetical protein